MIGSIAGQAGRSGITLDASVNAGLALFIVVLKVTSLTDTLPLNWHQRTMLCDIARNAGIYISAF